MVGWHHQLNGHEFEQALGDSEGQGSLVCCGPWGHKGLGTTEWLNSRRKASLLRSFRLAPSVPSAAKSILMFITLAIDEWFFVLYAVNTSKHFFVPYIRRKIKGQLTAAHSPLRTWHRNGRDINHPLWKAHDLSTRYPPSE